ncbi:MAG: alpha/beta hydrolase [Erysipelotrichaceae bacterium]
MLKKVLKVITVIIVSVLILLMLFLFINARRQMVPSDYTEKTKTGGTIENKYLQMGEYKVIRKEEKAFQGFEKYIIYYPEALSLCNKKWPVVVMANGSGIKASKYPALFEHLASWGFIVIGTEEEYDWNGFASDMCINHLIRLNETDELFKNKIDLDNVGITGHSQGGIGVISALTVQGNKDIYKAAVALSPASKELSDSIEWHYDASKINTPIMILGAENDWVATTEQFKSIYNDVDSAKILAIRKGIEHGEMLYAGDGYVTAWFMYYLQNDIEAYDAFFGDNPEIANNDFYLNVESYLE